MTAHVLSSDIDEIVERLDRKADAFDGRTILLTGGNGFIGRYFVEVVDRLNRQRLTRPCRTIVVDNLITSATVNGRVRGGGHVTFHEFDVTNPALASRIEGGIDYVIHAAGIASPFYYRKFPLETLEVATVGTKNLLRLSADRDVSAFLYFSSSEIYGDPDPDHVPTPESYRGSVSCVGPRACYDEAKRLGETLCVIYHQQHGVPTKSVRPFNVYGPGMGKRDYRAIPSFANSIVEGRPIAVYGTGAQTRTFCYITDAIVGFVLALLDGVRGDVYNIGAPAPEVSVIALVKAFEPFAGRPLAHKTIEYPDAYPGDEPMRRCPDISKARIQLGYEPRVDLHEGLSRFMTWARGVYRESCEL